MHTHVFPGSEEPDRLLRQAAQLTKILDVVVSNFSEEQRVSSEIAWKLMQGLSDIRLERLKSGSSSK